MTWSDPSTRSTGDLITAAIWNQDVVDNGQFLHDRVVPIPYALSTMASSLGDFPSQGATWRIAFRVPDNFESFDHAVILWEANTGTTEYDLNSDYGAPGGTENYNNHSESLLNQQFTVASSKIYEIDITGVLSSISPGDWVGVAITDSGGVGGEQAVGASLYYNAS